MKRKKILFTLPNLLGGGAERVVVNIINQLDIEYFDVYLLLINNDGNLHSSITSKIKVVNLNITRTRYSLFKMIKIINKIKPNIILSTTYRMNIYTIISSFFFKNDVKVFVREPNMPSLVIKNKNINIVNLFLIKFLYNYAYKIIAQTDEMKADIIKTYNVNENRIITILNPLDINYIKKSTINSTNPFNSKLINIVSSGRISKQKSYDVLIKAFKLVLDQNNLFRLFILGADSEGLKPKLLNLAKRFNIEDKIFFKGFTDNPYIYYKYSDLFVLSSSFEGLPNVILENLYLKKPIVTTNSIQYLNKLIHESKNGFIVDVGDYKNMAQKILKYKKLTPYNTYCGDNINEILKKYV